MSKTRTIQAALIGAGKRGRNAYGTYALQRPHELRFVAVAEPDAEKRELFANQHGIPPERQYASWEELLAEPQLCEALLICTMDREHYGPAMRAMDKGYHILLEKPMSHDALETLHLAEKAQQSGRILTVCHTMRYNPFSNELKRLLDAKIIGDLVSAQWAEHVFYEHYVSAFVRGNWRNAGKSSPMILQKSCHDMDMLQWLIGADCAAVSSFGKLTYFREENAPEGSTLRCTDGCAVERTCPFSAIRNYYHTKQGGWYNAVSLKPTLEARMKAIQEGPYGRCVFRCDNDVVDHQTVNLLFENDVTVSFTMTGFASEGTRTFKFMGTQGEIRGHSKKNEIEVNYFNGKQEKIYPPVADGAHGGGDFLIMRDFLTQVLTGDVKGRSDASVSARSHMIAFAAEHSRVTGQTVYLKDFVQSIRSEAIV
ncbi:Gfo/Idh/MocA family protein [Cohnella zeiphila]|uniref:Gfo/Idh/MocA family oxidoreductase n=1 Tax=Cohnella zeiphila TaxID=2761120 RepID=A0A7X0SP68_9BACL|nr:Gfo/Idh/MocA family oxidoreductase [Cohnella zeiphila]MBB6733632.1 Gfo/Idh/MocA family oxidoreductase [Cohnella zeiphila]